MAPITAFLPEFTPLPLSLSDGATELERGGETLCLQQPKDKPTHCQGQQEGSDWLQRRKRGDLPINFWGWMGLMVNAIPEEAALKQWRLHGTTSPKKTVLGKRRSMLLPGHTLKWRVLVLDWEGAGESVQ